MTSKIFRSTLTASLTVLLAALLVITGCLYGYFGTVQARQLLVHFIRDTLALKGTLREPLKLRGADLRVELAGQDLADLAQGAVGLPVDTWSLENWSVEEYEDMFQKIVSGEIAIDNDFSNLASTEHVALNIVE